MNNSVNCTNAHHNGFKEQNYQSQEQRQRMMGEEYEQYLHLMERYEPHNIMSLGVISKCLGYNGFDSFVNLYQVYWEKKFKTVCELSEQIKIQGLILSFNEQPHIIMHISLSLFPNLHTLDLTANKIQSIECLSRVYMPNLINLNLSANKITSLKPLNRVYLPSLSLLDLTSNLYTQIPSMLPTVGIELTRNVPNKAVMFKLMFTRTELMGPNRIRMMDYFR